MTKSQDQSGGRWQLIGSRRSPFVRKVTVLAEELGLAGRMDLVPVTVSFRKTEPEARNPHPLNQIPVLIVEGRAIYDSLVICDWLCAQAGATGAAFMGGVQGRHEVLTRQALAQAMMETEVKLYSEIRRSGADGLNDYGQAYALRLGRGWDAMEAGADGGGADGGPFDLGGIAAAAMLAYADFRLGHLDWRAGRPALAAWYEAVAARPSMRATEYLE